MREKTEQVIEREVTQTSLPQEASLTQIALSEEKQHRNMWRWMRHFFSEDMSPDNHPVIELQRRATWVGIALVLQALNEIDRRYYLPYVPFLKPWGGMIPFVLVLGSFAAIWMAFRPTTLKQQAERARGSSLLQARPHLWQRIVLVCVVLTSIAGGVEFGRSIALSFFLPPQYSNDGTSLDTNAAMLLVQGHNPYTDSNIITIVRQFPIEPYWTTPLRVGQFANRLQYPSSSEFRSVLDTDLKAGNAPEFESKVSYPALSFLTLVPFISLNILNVLAFYLICYIVLVAIAWKVARPELRPWILLLSLANVSMWTSVIGGNLDVLNILLIVLAWLLRERGWWSALFLGLALASKQLSWFFVPFYAMMVWRQYNFMEAARRITIAGGVALAINIPFILWNPHAWIAGVMAPMSDPMFPMGVGIVSLSSTPLLPFFSPMVYNVLELGAMLIALAYFWRLCKERPEAAMLLAVIPLFFAWRSLSSYFYCAALPLFILMAVRAFPAKSKRTRQAVDRSVLLPFDYDEPMISDIPAPVGTRVAFRGIYYFLNWAVTRLALIRQGLA
ncbi:MAG TPA: glycosyltransferase 87 family protein [Ktedonobacteraceae bacterium]